MNGCKLRELVESIEKPKDGSTEFLKWLKEGVTFHNTMVDCITAHRDGDTIVPKTEPLPSKALVIEDLKGCLPSEFHSMIHLGVKKNIANFDQYLNFIRVKINFYVNLIKNKKFRKLVFKFPKLIIYK